eukprot:c20570_g1_i4.p1 GENE.c20570_g1_i4~~c20570_g1_i4.p1  ORF type:complete len:327 (+),score=58.87 c20570_g1_i4:30-983(+)
MTEWISPKPRSPSKSQSRAPSPRTQQPQTFHSGAIEDLMKASRLGDWGQVASILHTSPTLIDVQSKGITPLLCAIEHGRDHVVWLLLKLGANANAPDKKNLTPLHYAFKFGRERVVFILRRCGAKLNVCDQDGDYPIHYALSCSKFFSTHLDSLTLCIQLGADVNVLKDGSSLLHIAVRYNNETAIEILLQHGVNVNFVDMQGETALMRAVDQMHWYAHLDLVQRFISAGTNVMIRNKRGQTLRDIARLRKHNSIVAIVDERLRERLRTFLMGTSRRQQTQHASDETCKRGGQGQTSIVRILPVDVLGIIASRVFGA